MKAFDDRQTIGEMATHKPSLAGANDSMGTDFCCSGTRNLAGALSEKGPAPTEVVAGLEQGDQGRENNLPRIDVSEMSLTELVNHIEKTHHAYVLEELPRLAEMMRNVILKHGEKDPRLKQVQQTYIAMAVELWGHMLREEQCLFPMIRQLEISNQVPPLDYGTIANPIRQMESEHDDADSALERLRELTDGFSPPSWACKTYRGLLAALAYFERDMRVHVQKENNVLFPRAMELEAIRRRHARVT
jgi:regulator of cell morphogenesis and NO signaling